MANYKRTTITATPLPNPDHLSDNRPAGHLHLGGIMVNPASLENPAAWVVKLVNHHTHEEATVLTNRAALMDLVATLQQALDDPARPPASDGGGGGR